MRFVLLALFGSNLALLVSSLGHFGENSNSCVDSCGDGFQVKYSIDLNTGKYELKDSQFVEILEDNIQVDDPSNECSRNMLIRIPFLNLPIGTIVKLELEYGDLSRGTSFHVGNSPTNDLFGADRNSTIYNSEMYANETNISYYMSSVNLCDQEYVYDPLVDISKILLLNESVAYLNPKSKIIIYVSEKWFRVDSLEKNTSFYYNNDYLFTFHKAALSERCSKHPMNKPPLNRLSPYLYIGLNRAIADAKISPGSGLCKVDVSFLDCQMSAQPDSDINVTEMKYKINDNETISWVTELNYLEPAIEHQPCSAQGVLKLKFDPNSNKKVARFDLELGQLISGFTFNMGDSPTNNAYGGDSGTTSNSAELHSNDNRFYVWLNTKYCGDTLLYKIEYNLFQSFDKVTMFISDQRVEMTNNRGYHEILKNPYLFNLNGQNVTCNCFDTRCYAGVLPDDDLYFGINRVIGGTYRPGIGLCKAKISWLQCNSNVKINNANIDFDYVNWSNSSAEIKLENVARVEIPKNESIINKVVNKTSDDVHSAHDQEKVEHNPCTKENINSEILYHEYKENKTKFIFCEGINKYKIISCPLNMKWSQIFQQCLEEEIVI